MTNPNKSTDGRFTTSTDPNALLRALLAARHNTALTRPLNTSTPNPHDLNHLLRVITQANEGETRDQ